jgi:hypothetical protein
MILTLLQIVAFAVVAISLVHWRACFRRRNTESWESLVARLRRGWSAHDLTESFLGKEGLSAPPEEIWKRMQGARGLWAMYRNAGVMLEMADYAARTSASINSELLASLRGDAVQIRVGALTALAQFALNKASDGLRFNAFQVASQYTGMAARMTQLLEENASTLVPDFVAAM